ncbi:hypothetical protein K469DRAFT_71901 [Zopfia rhizophila CBS 207.26]|uniref:Helicase ATP-binding domain-containing protein n=1 Tax=Zopfia rhizophila CBS 207.26 TaxID=1314779 RepID=A0A6A6EA31_9PEZI|nr:hypothetical protein K469DRAFT_71901 [Zopfia rhizophila CBS 207.26]
MSNYPIGGVMPFSSDGLEPPVDAVDTAETPPNEPPLENAQSSFNERIKLLGERTGYKLREGQVLALRELYNGKDVILVAMTGFGKTLIMMGFNSLFNAEDRSITVIKAIEQGQARESRNTYKQAIRPFVLNGDSNTLQNRHDIARGMYTHVWTSAEIALGDLYEDEDTQGVGDVEDDEGEGVDRSQASQNQRKRKRSKKKLKKKIKVSRKSRTTTLPDGYQDWGDFSSVLQDHEFRRRCRLLAIDEIHICAQDSWGGGFQPEFGQLAKVREQLSDEARLFGTTATLTVKNEVEIRQSAGFATDTIIIYQPGPY